MDPLHNVEVVVFPAGSLSRNPFELFWGDYRSVFDRERFAGNCDENKAEEKQKRESHNSKIGVIASHINS